MPTLSIVQPVFLLFLNLGMCKFEAIPAASCPSPINENVVPACTTKRYHSETSFCEGGPDTLGTSNGEDNCSPDWDVYQCIRGN